jgi:hypothetical protein
VESSVVAKPTKLSSLERAKTPAANLPTAQVKPQPETAKITSELKEKPAEPINITPAKDTSVPRSNERATTSVPQPITNNESPRETSAREAKPVNKAAAEALPTNKNEPVTSVSRVSEQDPKPAADKIPSVPETAKAQIETPKSKPTIVPATAAVEKNSVLTAGELATETATKPSGENVSANTAEKTAVPVVTAKSIIERPVVPEKKSPPVPSVQAEPETARSKREPLQELAVRSPGQEHEQKHVADAIPREQKQAERVGESAMLTAKPSEVSPSPQSKPTVPAVAGAASRAKPAPEQLALVRKPADVIVENKPITRAVKPLEGFIIQIAFNDKDKAQHWAESMERRGYAVSVTETGTEGALRVRLGNFVVRDDAERQLRSFKQEGLNGIIINLPQGFQPARSSVP